MVEYMFWTDCSFYLLPMYRRNPDNIVIRWLCFVLSISGDDIEYKPEKEMKCIVKDFVIKLASKLSISIGMAIYPNDSMFNLNLSLVGPVKTSILQFYGAVVLTIGNTEFYISMDDGSTLVLTEKGKAKLDEMSDQQK